MIDSIPASRPSRLPPWLLWLTTGLLGLSFLSGVLVWWGQTARLELDPEAGTGPMFVHGWLVVHGTLNPLLCAVFGFLLCHHVPLGWQMRANRGTGLAMVAVLGGLIASGAGLYYAGGEQTREWLVWAHRGLGLALPAILGLHWLQAIRWSRQPS